MFLVVGLGNPGEKYIHSRHNVGFLLLEEFVSSWEFDKYADAKVSKIDTALFVEPQTFMNLSGNAVRVLVDRFQIKPEHVVVLHDDIDLPFGAVRIVFQSGPGGHNGIRSIADTLKTNGFIRIKIGIAPTDEEGKAIKPKAGIFQSQKSAVARYVLRDFSRADIEKVKTLAPKIKDIIQTIVAEGREVAMNKFN